VVRDVHVLLRVVRSADRSTMRLVLGPRGRLIRTWLLVAVLLVLLVLVVTLVMLVLVAMLLVRWLVARGV